jgi:hypothetical protein
MLVASPYTVRSTVSQSDIQTFVSVLEGATVPITKDNMGGLSRLCEEFHFGELAERLAQFRESEDFKGEVTMEDSEARKRLSALEERMQQHDCDMTALRKEHSRQLRAQEKFLQTVTDYGAQLNALSSDLRWMAETETRPALAQLQSDLARLKADVSALQLAPSPERRPTIPPPSGSVSRAVVPISSAPAPTSPASAVAVPPSGWNSAIVPDFPTLLEDFKEKRFTLLWRGSRDGCDPRDFHRHCDKHPNTLTVILDTQGNIFGGFTPVKWKSPRKPFFRDDDGLVSKNTADPSLRSFLFTLKNPHNVPARRFALKAEQKKEAICCDSYFGPCFSDLGVVNAEHATTAGFGVHYTNDTELDGKTFFTGAEWFQVREIEVFEIID